MSGVFGESENLNARRLRRGGVTGEKRFFREFVNITHQNLRLLSYDSYDSYDPKFLGSHVPRLQGSLPGS